jgi:hypothetical protein
VSNDGKSLNKVKKNNNKREEITMAIKVSKISQLQEYFSGVVKRSNHHAGKVGAVIYPLLGFIILYSDADRDIEVREYAGSAGNILWSRINSNRYAFKYNHEKQVLELHMGKHNGPVLHEFDDDTTVERLKEIFESLVE